MYRPATSSRTSSVHYIPAVHNHEAPIFNGFNNLGALVALHVVRPMSRNQSQLFLPSSGASRASLSPQSDISR